MLLTIGQIQVGIEKLLTVLPAYKTFFPFTKNSSNDRFLINSRIELYYLQADHNSLFVRNA